MKKVTIIIVTVLLVLSVIGYIFFQGEDESYQKAMDPIRIKGVDAVLGIIFKYYEITGEMPYSELTTEKPVMSLIGHSEEAEEYYAQLEVLKRGAYVISSKKLEATLSQALDEEIVLPRDPQKDATYAPNVYIYLYTGEQVCVASHLYNEHPDAKLYEWEGGKFYSYAKCFSKPKT